MGPDKNINQASLWARITEQPRANKTVPFPRNGANGEPICNVVLQVLTPSEQVLSAAKADEQVKEKLGVQKIDERGNGYNTAYDAFAAVEILYRSARHPDDVSRSFFPSPEAIMQHLTADEVGVLMRAYGQMTSEVGPIVNQLSPVEMDAWLAALATGAELLSPFYRLTLEQQRALVVHGARRLHRLQMENSSPG